MGYKCSDRFRISLGVVATSLRIEDSFFAYPYLGINWNVTEKVAVKVYGNQNGPEARITTRLSEEFSAFMYGAYQSRSYRLSDDSPVPTASSAMAASPSCWGSPTAVVTASR